MSKNKLGLRTKCVAPIGAKAKRKPSLESDIGRKNSTKHTKCVKRPSEARASNSESGKNTGFYKMKKINIDKKMHI